MMTRALLVASLVLLAPAVHAAPAAEPARKDVKEVLKQVQGWVSAVNKHGIAVDYERSTTASKEMYLPFASSFKVQGVKGVADLHVGDSVLIEYRETLEKDERGAYSKSSRVAVRVVFLAPAPPEAVAPAAKGASDGS